MGYNKQEVIDMALEVIEKHNIIFIGELCAYLPISRPTFYSWGLDKIDKLKDAIKVSKIKQKSAMREKWYESDNATLQLAGYRLMSEPEEHKLLSQNYVDVTTQGDKINGSVMVTMDEAKRQLEELDNEI